MNQHEVKKFFDRLAPNWDKEQIRSDAVIGQILDIAGIKKGADVLDIGCGTGVLIGDYLARSVASVTGVDLSPEMLKIAQEKFPCANVQFICGDAQSYPFDRLYDNIMIYNAFPHFPDPQALIAQLSKFLKPGGTLTVAHGMSRADIDRHHAGAAQHVSVGLMHEDSLAAIFSQHLTVTAKISTDTMYQVTGQLPIDNGERWERCLWQMKRPERVAAVCVQRRRSVVKAHTGHRNRIMGSDGSAGFPRPKASP